MEDLEIFARYLISLCSENVPRTLTEKNERTFHRIFQRNFMQFKNLKSEYPWTVSDYLLMNTFVLERHCNYTKHIRKGNRCLGRWFVEASKSELFGWSNYSRFRIEEFSFQLGRVGGLLSKGNCTDLNQGCKSVIGGQFFLNVLIPSRPRVKSMTVRPVYIPLLWSCAQWRRSGYNSQEKLIKLYRRRQAPTTINLKHQKPNCFSLIFKTSRWF